MEKEKKPVYKRWWFWVIIVVVVFVIIGSVGGGSDSATDVTDANETAKTEETETAAGETEAAEDTADAEETDDRVTVGSTFETGDLRITVDSADTDFTDYEDDYGIYAPNDGMKYIKVSFTFENVGESGDEYVSIYDFDCYADNVSCEQKYSLDSDNFINTNLSAGRQVSFSTYYEVPVDAQSIELEYTENMFTDSKVMIVIQ